MKTPDSPKIDRRKFSDILAALQRLAPHYTPEWSAQDPQDPGVGLLKIFSNFTEGIIKRINQVPRKHLVAFLDMLGIKLLPAQPSRVPLQFTLAEGTPEGIFIPARTQAEAGANDQREEPLPFETEENLQATSSVLDQVFSVDPQQDAIYQPPRGFLERPLPDTSNVTYQTLSLALAESVNLQLDHVEGLEEKDMLQIRDAGGIEYVIIEKIEGNIILLQEKLPRNIPPGTAVRKMTQFQIYESKNLQSHELYLGHNDLFNVESKAKFILYITHIEGTTEGLEPLAVSWEYWGELAGKEGEDWRPFTPEDENHDYFVQDDIVVLTKPGEGAITEKEINGIKSRWLRCRLLEPLPVNVPRLLPVLDNIRFVVESAASDLLPDQAFNNDTPLDVASPPFLPFGSEPRQYDRFYLASEEVFSKQGAEVTIDVKADLRGILAAPSAIYDASTNIVKVFARGTGGRVVELDLDPPRTDPPRWFDHGFPPETSVALGSNPCAMVNQSGKISVFVRAENGNLFELFYNGVQWEWFDRGTPAAGVKIAWDPHCIAYTSTSLRAYVFGSDDKFYAYERNYGASAGQWIVTLKPPRGWKIKSAPFAINYLNAQNNPRRTKVFVRGKGAKLYDQIFEWDSIHNTWNDGYDGTYLNDPNIDFVDVGSKPFAVGYTKIEEDETTNDYAKIFVIDSIFKYLFELDTFTPSGSQDLLNWASFGKPSNTNMALASTPHGYIENAGTNNEIKRIFVRGEKDEEESSLFETNGIIGYDDTSDVNKADWINHGHPANANLRLSPFALTYPVSVNDEIENYLSVFSASDKNSIIEITGKVIDQDGDIQGAKEDRIRLESSASTRDDYYKYTALTVRSTPLDYPLRRITKYTGNTRVAEIWPLWDTTNIPNAKDDRYHISHIAFEGQCAVQSDLQDPIIIGTNDKNDYIGMQIEIRSNNHLETYLITNYDTVSHEAVITPPPTTFAGSTRDCRIFCPAHYSQPETFDTSTVTLDDSASEVEGEYNNMFLELIIKYREDSNNKYITYRRTITNYTIEDGESKIKKITVSPELQDLPPVILDVWYVISRVHNGRAQELENANEGTSENSYFEIKLSADEASLEANFYQGMWIGISDIDAGSDHDAENRGRLRKIVSYDPSTKVAVIDESDPWLAPPNSNTFYVIYPLRFSSDGIHLGNIQIVEINTAPLAGDASGEDDYYNNMLLKIVSGNALNQVRRIEGYEGSNRVATLTEEWKDEIPDGYSKYLISGAFLDIWNAYKDENEENINPALSWEYWNGKGWVVLKDLTDETENFLINGLITFNIPNNLVKTEVSGQENFWIRARIIGGDYGKETFEIRKIDDTISQLISSKSSIRPPLIVSLTIGYNLVVRKYPQRCLTYNNLDYLDQTGACNSEETRFEPFVRLEDPDKTLYLGFRERLVSGPLKIFFAARELAYDDAFKPKVSWTYRGENDWKRLSFDDASEGLIRAEILAFIGARDFTRLRRFGNSRFWVRGTLAEGHYLDLPVLDGIYPNSTWAFQAETILDEILGSSDGTAGQSFRFFKFPVRAGEEVRVREVLTQEEQDALIAALGDQAVKVIPVEEVNGGTETWVLWQEVDDFFASAAEGRHYTLDRATGEIRFGDGEQGLVPPAGRDNIRAFAYQSGGGAAGNVAASEISDLVTALAGVDSVLNPAGADGGADTAPLEQMLQIGPAMISHRRRAVSSEDFEWLARAASRKVVRARCLPNRNNLDQNEAGWVSVVIIPDSPEAQPAPSLALRSLVRDYLEAHCANIVAAPQHVHVLGPSYVTIDVSMDLVVADIELAASAEQQAREKLDAFFHPLSGGSGAGWDFGQYVSASDVYALLESIAAVDHIENLIFSYNGQRAADLVAIADHQLAANGSHTINLRVNEGEPA